MQAVTWVSLGTWLALTHEQRNALGPVGIDASDLSVDRTMLSPQRELAQSQELQRDYDEELKWHDGAGLQRDRESQP